MNDVASTRSKRRLLNAVSRLAVTAILLLSVVAMYWVMGRLNNPRHAASGVFVATAFYSVALSLVGWMSFAYYGFYKTTLFRVGAFFALFVWGCVIYCLYPVDRSPDDPVLPRVHLRNQVEAVNRCYATFFPSRGGFECAENIGWVQYHAFQVAVAFYLSMLMFSLLGRGFVNRMRIVLSREDDLNVFWGMSPQGLTLAKDIMRSTLREQVLFWLPSEQCNDSSDRAKLTSELDKEDCIWVFGEFDKVKDVRGVRHFFMSESGHENVALANRLVSYLRLKPRRRRPTFYIRIEPSAAEQVYLDWAESVKTIVTPVILRESAIIAQQFAKEHPALGLPGISINPDTRIVTGCFNNLLLGFDSVGESVLNAMICNSQFKGSSFKTDVVALNANDIARYMRTHGEAVSSYGLSFHTMDVFGGAFEEWVKERMTKYNRIVICLSTDDCNIRAAMNLVRIAKDVGSPLDRRILFVKVVNPDIYDYCSGNGDISVGNFFGNPGKIYTLEMLNQDPIDAMAKALNAEWAGAPGGEDMQRVWDAASYADQQSSRASALGEINHLNVLGYTLKGQAGSGDECEDSEVADAIAKHLQVVSENEHLRWNAYHRTLGYSTWDMVNPPIECMPFKKANQLKALRRHAAIVDFDKLPDVDLKLACAINPANGKRFTRNDFVGNVRNDLVGDGKKFTASMQAYDMMFCSKIVDNAHVAGVGGFRRFGNA